MGRMLAESRGDKEGTGSIAQTLTPIFIFLNDDMCFGNPGFYDG